MGIAHLDSDTLGVNGSQVAVCCRVSGREQE